MGLLKLDNMLSCTRKKGNFTEWQVKRIRKWVEELIARGVNERSITNYVYAILQFSLFLQKKFRKVKSYKQVNKDMVIKYVSLLQKEKKPATINQYKNYLRIFYDHIYDVMYDKGKNPFLSVLKNQGGIFYKEGEILKVEDIDKLMKACENTRDMAILAVLWETGARKNEILSVKLRDLIINEDVTYIKVKNSKRGKCKSRQEEYRKLWIEIYHDILSAWLKDHPLRDNPEASLFVCLKKKSGVCEIGDPMTEDSLAWLLQKLKKKTKFKKHLNPHWFRHSRSTILSHDERFSEVEFCMLMDWVPGSQQARRYLHNKSEDIIKKFEEMRGKKTKTKDIVISPLLRPCSNCKTLNDIRAAKFCKGCGTPLDLKAAIELDQKESMMTNLIIKIAKAMEKNSKEKIHFEELDFIIQPNKEKLKTINKVKLPP